MEHVLINTSVALMLFFSLKLIVTGLHFNKRIESVHQLNMKNIDEHKDWLKSTPTTYSVEMEDWWKLLFNPLKWTYKQHFKYLKEDE